MSDSLKKLIPSGHIWTVYIISAIILIITFFVHWGIGILLFVILGVSLYYTIVQERQKYQNIEHYIAKLSHRIKRVGEEALLEMPIGIILFDENYKIEWSNPYMNQFAEADSLVGEPLNILSEEITSLINQDRKSTRLNSSHVAISYAVFCLK